MLGIVCSHAQAISRIDVKQTGHKKGDKSSFQIGASVMQTSPDPGALEIWYVYKSEDSPATGPQKLSKTFPFNLRTLGSRTQDVEIYPYLNWVVFIRDSKGAILGYKASNAFAEAGAVKIAEKAGGLPGKTLGAR